MIITADTESKTLEVTIDGMTIPNVSDASVYLYRDSNGNAKELYGSVYTVEKSDNGVTKRVTYHAEGSEKAQNAIASGIKVYTDVKGFVGISDESEAALDIDEFLSSQKKGY